VALRRRELGVRTALGAAPRRLAGEVARESLRLAAAAALLALPFAWAAGRLLGGELWRVPPSDPVSFVFAVLAVGAVAAVSSLVPARRAARVDPISVLRAE
jgi:ABC-type antimicrobial peptide transport system permease subunit